MLTFNKQFIFKTICLFASKARVYLFIYNVYISIKIRMQCTPKGNFTQQLTQTNKYTFESKSTY